MSAPPPDLDLRSDCYRRAILCRSVSDDTVVTDLEDDFHHFRATVEHAAGTVTRVSCESVRWPWTACPDAAANLEPLVGAPVGGRFTDASNVADPRINCTHQFDCAAHALMHAGRDAESRRYDVEVPRRDENGDTSVRLWIDGRPALTWRIRGSQLVDAEPPFDRAPRKGFMAWADRELDPEAAEAAIVLRRGLTIGMGRGWPFDDYDNAGQVEIATSGVCYTMTPGRAESALRVRGMIRDFATNPDALLDGNA